MAFELSRKAVDDLEQIYRESLAQFGLRQAERYYELIFEKFELLSDYPQLARLRLEFAPPVRAQLCESHVIVYVENGHDILIVRLFHARQDWAHLL